jgi:hypothetical protein
VWILNALLYYSSNDYGVNPWFHIHKYSLSEIKVILMEGFLLSGHLFIGLTSSLCFQIFIGFQSMIEYILWFLQSKLDFLFIFCGFSMDVQTSSIHSTSKWTTQRLSRLPRTSASGPRLDSASVWEIQSVDFTEHIISMYIYTYIHILYK